MHINDSLRYLGREWKFRKLRWGELLGSAVALALAAEKPVGHLVLEAPFTSAADVGAQHYWFVPVRLFMKDQFRSDLRVSKVTAPVLVVHGENDAIVPIRLGERLYGLIRAPRRFVSVAGAGHNDLGDDAVAAAKRSAVIRNPYMSANLSRPFRAPIRGHILLFEPLQSPSFRPDPQSLKAVARRAGQEWPSR